MAEPRPKPYIEGMQQYDIKIFRTQADGTLLANSDPYFVIMSTLEMVESHARDHLQECADKGDVIHVELDGRVIYRWSLPANA